MDLKKRIEKLEGRQVPVSPTPPVDTEIRELTIEEWNELYVKPIYQSWGQKPTAGGGVGVSFTLLLYQASPIARLRTRRLPIGLSQAEA